MTELHNMSVPPRSILTVQRAELSARRYRITIGPCTRLVTGLDDAALTRYFRKDGAACALALLDADTERTIATFRAAITRHRRDPAAPAALRQACDAARQKLRLPEGFGCFVEETSQRDDEELSGVDAVAILAARSGPLYLPGRFEPSLINLRDVTLCFPSSPGTSPDAISERARASARGNARDRGLRGAL